MLSMNFEFFVAFFYTILTSCHLDRNSGKFQNCTFGPQIWFTQSVCTFMGLVSMLNDSTWIALNLCIWNWSMIFHCWPRDTVSRRCTTHSFQVLSRICLFYCCKQQAAFRDGSCVAEGFQLGFFAESRFFPLPFALQNVHYTNLPQICDSQFKIKLWSSLFRVFPGWMPALQ